MATSLHTFVPNSTLLIDILCFNMIPFIFIPVLFTLLSCSLGQPLTAASSKENIDPCSSDISDLPRDPTTKHICGLHVEVSLKKDCRALVKERFTVSSASTRETFLEWRLARLRGHQEIKDIRVLQDDRVISSAPPIVSETETAVSLNISLSTDSSRRKFGVQYSISNTAMRMRKICPGVQAEPNGNRTLIRWRCPSPAPGVSIHGAEVRIVAVQVGHVKLINVGEEEMVSTMLSSGGLDIKLSSREGPFDINVAADGPEPSTCNSEMFCYPTKSAFNYTLLIVACTIGGLFAILTIVPPVYMWLFGLKRISINQDRTVLEIRENHLREKEKDAMYTSVYDDEIGNDLAKWDERQNGDMLTEHKTTDTEISMSAGTSKDCDSSSMS